MIALVSIGYGTLAGFLAPVLGLQWRLTLYAGIGACVNVVLNVLLIPQYGAVGSAWATVVTEILTMALLLATCLHGLRLRLRIGPILATFASAGVMALVMEFTDAIGLIPALIAGGATYAAALFGFRVVNIDELRRLVEI
jgi:O-antigen/teichoic acid export membrane protein